MSRLLDLDKPKHWLIDDISNNYNRAPDFFGISLYSTLERMIRSSKNRKQSISAFYSGINKSIY